jgi:chorismate mutase/prephenate dehydratase
LMPSASGQDQTSLVLSVPNKPGAVYELLAPLARHGVSMTRFESRPARTGRWDYYFYVDIEGHANDVKVAQALAELQSQAAFFKVLGSYPHTS